MIRNYINQLGNSRAIFSLSLNSSKNTVYSAVVDKYDPPDDNDAIGALVVNRYSESLRGNQFTKDTDSIEKQVLGDIRTEFRRFVVNYGGFKNAKQSSVHRFLNVYNVPAGAVDGLVYLYKYAKLHGMTQGAMPGAFTDADQKHIDNILAILELLRSKFEQK